MTKPVIDTAMVRRFEKAALRCDPTGAWVCQDTRAGLQAALNPPAEIDVTEDMIEACIQAAVDSNIQSLVTLKQLMNVYKAVEIARRQETGESYGLKTTSPEREKSNDTR